MGRTIHAVLIALAVCAMPLHAGSACKLVRIAEWTVKAQTGSLIALGRVPRRKSATGLAT